MGTLAPGPILGVFLTYAMFCSIKKRGAQNAQLMPKLNESRDLPPKKCHFNHLSSFIITYHHLFFRLTSALFGVNPCSFAGFLFCRLPASSVFQPILQAASSCCRLLAYATGYPSLFCSQKHLDNLGNCIFRVIFGVFRKLLRKYCIL